MTRQFGNLIVRRTKRMTAGKSRYINFAQDDKGRIVSWGYWGKGNTIEEFINKLLKKRLKGGAELRMIIKINYRKGRPGHFFMSEIHIDAEYPIRNKDSELIKSFVMDKFKNNSELLRLGIKAMDGFTEGRGRIPYNEVSLSFIQHTTEPDVDYTRVTAKAFVRGIDRTSEIELSAIKLYVQNHLEGIE